MFIKVPGRFEMQMKLHVNRTCFHAGLESQTGMSSFRISCERTVNQNLQFGTLFY